MKNLLKCSVLVGLAVLIALPLAAEEKKKKKGEKGGQRNPLARQVKQLSGKVDLSKEQQKQLDDLAKTHGEKLAAANKKMGNARQLMAAARKKAVDEGKKGKELRDAIEEVLSDEQIEARKQATGVLTAFRKAVSEVLTKEQREKAGLSGKKGGDKKKGEKKKKVAA